MRGSDSSPEDADAKDDIDPKDADPKDAAAAPSAARQSVSQPAPSASQGVLTADGVALLKQFLQAGEVAKLFDVRGRDDVFHAVFESGLEEADQMLIVECMDGGDGDTSFRNLRELLRRSTA